MPELAELCRLQGTPKYQRFLDKLIKAYGENGMKIPEGNYLRLVELALAREAFRFEILAPKRTNHGKGGARAGAGRKPKTIDPTST